VEDILNPARWRNRTKESLSERTTNLSISNLWTENISKLGCYNQNIEKIHHEKLQEALWEYSV